MTPDTGILTHLLSAFLTVFDGGWGALRPSAMSLFGILVGIELTLSGLWWAMSGDDAVKGLIQKLLVIGLFFFFIQQWQMLATTTMQSFARAGATAGNASAAPGSIDLADPSAIVEMGFAAIQPLSNKVDALTSGSWSTLKNLGLLMQIGLAMIGILFSFFLLGIQCFLVYIEFYIVAILSLILLPFGVFRHTAFMAEKAFGAVIAHGIKLMVLAFIIAIAQPVLQQITVPVDFSMRDAWCTLLAAMTICFLSWHAPGIAAGLLAGSPTLSAGHAASTAFNTGRAVAFGSAGVASLGRSAASGAGATVQAASALKTGAGVGAANAAQAGAGPIGQAMGAAGGAAKAVNPFANVAARMRKRVAEGELQGFAAHDIGAQDAESAPSNSRSPAADGGAVPSRPSPTPSAASSSEFTAPSGSAQSAPRASETKSSSSFASATTRSHAPDAPADGKRGTSPAATQALDAARIAPGQRRLDDAQDAGTNESIHLATTRDAATDPVTQAAKAARPDETPPSGEPQLKVAEPPSPKLED